MARLTFGKILTILAVYLATGYALARVCNQTHCTQGSVCVTYCTPVELQLVTLLIPALITFGVYCAWSVYEHGHHF